VEGNVVAEHTPIILYGLNRGLAGAWRARRG
jgi:hypothetical protein